MSEQHHYSVGQLAELAHVSVRTLHHYDHLGLLSPSERTGAGYRQYTRTDLDRLQRVLCYRELGFSLEEIRAILTDRSIDPLEHLSRQHRLLRARADRLRQVIAAVETAMEARQMGINLDPHEMFEVFGEHDASQHAEEVEQRWGDTDAYQESKRRATRYTKQDWLQIKEESGRAERTLADALAAGRPADSAEGMDAAEAHRLQIDRWFYPCDHRMQCSLADMYLADPRFTEHYEQVAPGLAQYVHDAIKANAARAGAPS